MNQQTQETKQWPLGTIIKAPPEHSELKLGAIYENWRTHHLSDGGKKMLYYISELRYDRTVPDDKVELRVIYGALYEGGEGGDRSISDFFAHQERAAGEKRPTDPAYNGPRFIYRGRMSRAEFDLQRNRTINEQW